MSVLGSIVGWTLSRRRLVVAAAVLLLVYGVMVLGRARYDVFPEFVPAQAEVQTEAPGLTAEQVEALVTRPIEQAVNGAAGVAAVRSDSIQGLSIVTVVFADGSDPYRARQVVTEALGEAAGSLPTGVAAPTVAPLTSSTMDLLKVGFTSDRLSPMALRDLVQWTVRPRLLATPGVARAVVYGGEVRRIEVRFRPARLAALGFGPGDLLTAVRQATGVVGAGFIDTPQQRVLVEPRGQAKTAKDLAQALLPTQAGETPVRIGDVAEVLDAPAPAKGDALVNGKPGVVVILASQFGVNTLEATRAVEASLAELRPALEAQGVTMNAGLHRPANFIETALRGIAVDLAVGAVMIGLVLLLFLRNPRAVVVSFVSIPLSLLTAVVVLDALGWSINTMTLGGLAVALGVVVDDAVIDVENIVRRMRAATGEEPMEALVLRAALEVRAPVVYATLVIVLVLAPVLLLHGLQGAFFAPLAAAFIVATLASLAVAIVLTPPLTLLVLKHARLPDEPAPLVRAKDWHDRLLVRVCARPGAAVAASLVAAALAIGGLALFQSELLPSFREGHFVIGVEAPPGTSLAVMRGYGQAISRDLLAIDGVQSVEQAAGRSEGGEDTWGTDTGEFHVELKPHLSAGRQDEVEAKIHAVLDLYPGLQTEVLTFLGDRIGESLTGETAALAISVFGADLDTLDATARQVAAVLEKTPGALDVAIQSPAKTPSMRVDLDPARMAALGVALSDVQDAVQAAYEGAPAAQVYEEDRTVDIVVTTEPEARQDPEAVGQLLVRTANGVAAPLNRLARVSLSETRTSISHQGGRARQVVTANPKPQDVQRVTRAAEAAIASEVKLPPGVYLSYASAAEQTTAAQRELLFDTAASAVGVVGLLLLCFGSGAAAALILSGVPFALLGGVIAVALTGRVLSLGSLVGFVTLFGISARNGILIVAHTQQVMVAEGRPWSLETVVLATRERTTPVLMTALVTALGLAPLAIQTGEAGREIQGPMAIVILGGLVTSTVVSLVLLPVLIWRFGPLGRGARAPEAPVPA